MTDPNYVPPNTTLLGDEHVRRYRETDGEVGYLWNGATTLLPTTTGCKSGEQRTNPLIFAPDGDNFIVVASLGGAPNHPAWYLNLQARAEVEIQVRGDRIRVTARTADAGEKPRLWKSRHGPVAELRRLSVPHRSQHSGGRAESRGRLGRGTVTEPAEAPTLVQRIRTLAAE